MSALTMRTLRRLGCLACLVVAAGCFAPSFDSGKLRCSPVGDECPPGYACESGLCYKNSERDAAAPGQDQGGPDNGDGGVAAGGDMAEGMTLALGQTCASGAQCVSGICSDNVCCDKSCDGLCVSCSAQGSVGTCTPVLRGVASPVGHPSCTSDDKSTCQKDGTCDGAGGCALWPAATVCKGSSCDSGTQKVTPTSTCDGKGTCVTPTAITCSPYVCEDTTQCWPSCTTGSTTQCAGSFSCVNSSCGTKPQGSTCGGDSECTSGHCADGVCCDSVCSGTCERCDQAQARGTCSAVTGQAGHGSCSGFGTTCGSSCNGSNRTTCLFAGAGTGCSDGNACTYNDVCNGSGGCGGTGLTCPANTQCTSYSCNGTATCAVAYGNGNSCNDGNACTYNDVCNGAGGCAGTTVTCPSAPTCQNYVCNGTSTCTLQQDPVGTVCGKCTCGDYECNASGSCVSAGCHSLPCP